MNIEIPSFIRDEKVEGAIVFMALVYRLCRKHGFSDTRYFIDSSDVRMTMQHNIANPQSVFGKWVEWFRIAKCSDSHWFFEWQHTEYKTELYEIQDPELKQVWTYLVCRMQSDKDLVEDWNEEGFPTERKNFLKKREDRGLFQCVGKPTTEAANNMLKRRKIREANDARAPKRRVGRPRGSKNKNNQ